MDGWIKQFNVSLSLESALSSIDEYELVDDELITVEALMEMTFLSPFSRDP